jgi:hypothetical protein
MADRFELSYIYARVCGALSRSWAGPRSAELLRQGRPSDLWRSLFNDSPPLLPERSFVAELEARVVREAFEEFRLYADQLQQDEPFFLATRRKAEFARVKRVLLAVRDADSSCPPCDDPKLPEGFKPAAFPRLEAMFAGGSYSWITPAALDDLPAAENRLDRQYYAELWEALKTVPASRAAGLRRFLALEIELENVIWAIRLSRYYAMGPEAIKPLLVSVDGLDLSSMALAAAGFKIDRRQDWDGWKYAAYLKGGGEPWSIDVRALEAGLRKLLYRKARLTLHLNPASYAPLYCFFKLKEFETAVVLGIIEGVHLGAPAEEIAAFALAGGAS